MVSSHLPVCICVLSRQDKLTHPPETGLNRVLSHLTSKPAMSKVQVLMAFVEFGEPVFQPRSILGSSGCPGSSDLAGSLKDSHSWSVYCDANVNDPSRRA